MLKHCSACRNILPMGARFCGSCGTTLGIMTPTGLLPAQSVLQGRYIILEKVGQGGMGAVYKALDLVLQKRVVAVKEMSQDGLAGQELQEAIDAFSREANILTQLKHRSLPHIYAQFEDYGRRYLVMEFIEGETLEHQLEVLNKREKRPALAQILSIGTQLCAVLDYLHLQQPPVIFRDLKPANIMLQAPDRVYLIDFGIARLFKPGQLKDTVALGSPGYAAPEQYGQASSPRSDIYSLGATLHQMITGIDPAQKPFHFQPFSINLPRLEQLITRMVDLDEANRPVTAADVINELHAIALDITADTVSGRSRSVQLQPASTSAPAPITMCAVLSSAPKDRSLWRAIHTQLLTLVDAIPDITLKEVYLTGDDLTLVQTQALDASNLLLLCLSNDFLSTPACMLAAEKAINNSYKTQNISMHTVLLYPCTYMDSRLYQLKVRPEDVVAHRSVYAQEQRILDAARKIRKQLVPLVLEGKSIGRMNLLQWLFLLLFGEGCTDCPYFVVGPYALKYIRSTGLAGMLIRLLDLQNNRGIAEYVIGSHTQIDLSNLLPIIAPASRTPETVQGRAQREKPLKYLKL